MLIEINSPLPFPPLPNAGVQQENAGNMQMAHDVGYANATPSRKKES